MRACNVDLDKLRRNLVAYIEFEMEELVTDGADDSKPTAGFPRVIQRAVIHVQSSGREEVSSANVLVAIFAERESHAAYFLHEQEMTRYDAVNYISYGTAKRPGPAEQKPFSDANVGDETRTAGAGQYNAFDALKRQAAKSIARYEKRLSGIERDLVLLKWMTATVLAGGAALVVKTFFR